MLDGYCEQIERANQARDGAALQAAVEGLWGAAQQADVAELDAVLPRLCGLLGDLPTGPGGHVATLAGAMVERGADAEPMAGPVGEGLAECLEAALAFVGLWRQIHGADAELPDPEGDIVEHAMDTLLASGIPEIEQFAFLAVSGWISLPIWERPALACLQRKTGRAGFGRRDDISAYLEQLGEVYDLHWVAGLLAVLDDETLIVLHRETGRGYQVTVGGIGDNFQLHTLLAATLSGPAADGLLPDVRPTDGWISAATTGDVYPPDGPVAGQFNLVDAYGKWIWNEGTPADIPALGDHRVVVLDPPPYHRTWNIGRQYPMMAPSMRLDRVLPADEAGAWLGKVLPAGE